MSQENPVALRIPLDVRRSSQGLQPIPDFEVAIKQGPAVERRDVGKERQLPDQGEDKPEDDCAVKDPW